MPSNPLTAIIEYDRRIMGRGSVDASHIPISTAIGALAEQYAARLDEWLRSAVRPGTVIERETPPARYALIISEAEHHSLRVVSADAPGPPLYALATCLRSYAGPFGLLDLEEEPLHTYPIAVSARLVHPGRPRPTDRVWRGNLERIRRGTGLPLSELDGSVRYLAHVRSRMERPERRDRLEGALTLEGASDIICDTARSAAASLVAVYDTSAPLDGPAEVSVHVTYRARLASSTAEVAFT